MDEQTRLIQGDCVEVMRAMDEESIYAIVCDPPYGLEFMGKSWDKLDGAHSRGTNYAKIGDGGSDYPKNRNQGGVVYSGGPNPTCRNCGGLRSLNAEGSGGRSKCRCDHPDFPDYRGPAARAMQEWHYGWAVEALRVLKPGGHLLAFGGTRTYHRLACALEDAGFEIRDTVAWMYGSGFPKSLNVAKAIDSAKGVEGERGAMKRGGERLMNQAPEGKRDGEGTWGDESGRDPYNYVPSNDEAKQWEGWGTALKPAFEPIVVARKPLIATVAANVMKHGTGGLNIEKCRAGISKNVPASPRRAEQGAAYGELGNDPGTGSGWDPDVGRWPANVLLDEAAAELLDEQTGDLGISQGGRIGNAGGGSVANIPIGAFAGDPGYGDSGGASRFFYVAKASRSERDAGLDEMPSVRVAQMEGSISPEWDNDVSRRWATVKRNTHPTVKPIEVMRWLVRLVTPPGGVVLDPFMGSGTTGCAASLEGFSFVGVERDEGYMRIAEARIAFWEKHGADGWRIVRESDAAEAKRERVRDSGQIDIFEALAE